MIYYDPFQMVRSAQVLTMAGYPCEAFDQTLGHLTSATENLLSLFTSKGLRLYPHADLREHCINAITVESAKGIRLAKGSQSAKIDACAALSFAALAAVRAGKPPPLNDMSAMMTRGTFSDGIAASIGPIGVEHGVVKGSVITWGQSDHIDCAAWIRAHRVSDWNPLQHLMAAVLTMAIWDATQRKRRDAREWIASKKSDWLFSFEVICECLGLDAAAVRKAIEAGYKAQDGDD